MLMWHQLTDAWFRSSNRWLHWRCQPSASSHWLKPSGGPSRNSLASHHGLASMTRVPYLTNFWLIWLLFFLFILGSRALRTAVIQVATIKKNGWWNWMSRFACSLTAVYIWLRILLSPSIHFNFNNASQSVESFLSILRKYDSDLEAFPFRYRLFVCTMSLSNIETNWD
jgi:hypothetical protein